MRKRIGLIFVLVSLLVFTLHYYPRSRLETARGYLTRFYTISENRVRAVNFVQDVLEYNRVEQVPMGYRSLLSMPEVEVTKEYILSQVNGYASSQETTYYHYIMNQHFSESFQEAKVASVELEEVNNFQYTYQLTVEAIYTDGKVKTYDYEGTVELVNEDNKWYVSKITGR